MSTGSQPIQTAISIFTRTAFHATNDPWLTRHFFGQETFLPRVKENGRKLDELKRYSEKTITPSPLIINDCEKALATKPTKPTTNGFVVLLYVQGVSERIGRLLNQQ